MDDEELASDKHNKEESWFEEAECAAEEEVDAETYKMIDESIILNIS